MESGPAETPPPGVLRWIDIEDPTRELLEELQRPYGLHPLAIEDCLTFEQRPKLEEYPGHLFVVIHELATQNGELGALEGHEIHTFLGENFLITVHPNHCAPLRQLRTRVLGDLTLRAKGVAFIYYLLSDTVAAKNSDVVDGLTDRVDLIEEAILDPHQERALERLLELKRALGAARRALSPQRDLFATLARVEHNVMNDRVAFYFRDVYDKIVRSVESIEVGRELLSNMLDAHFALVSQRTNEIVKRLTILSAIFLPLTFITGFFGQNFDHLPFDSDALMWSAMFLCALVPPLMLTWFRRMKWI